MHDGVPSGQTGKVISVVIHDRRWPQTQLLGEIARGDLCSRYPTYPRIVERERNGPGQRGGISRVLRLAPAHPEHAEVQRECAIAKSVRSATATWTSIAPRAEARGAHGSLSYFRSFYS